MQVGNNTASRQAHALTYVGDIVHKCPLTGHCLFIENTWAWNPILLKHFTTLCGKQRKLEIRFTVKPMLYQLNYRKKVHNIIIDILTSVRMLEPYAVSWSKRWRTLLSLHSLSLGSLEEEVHTRSSIASWDILNQLNFCHNNNMLMLKLVLALIPTYMYTN